MKPKDLKSPYSFQERTLCLKEGVFYLPEHFYDFSSFQLPSWPILFGNNQPIAIEFCAGNGAWIERKAIEEPAKNWVAVEKRFDRVRKIWAKKQNSDLSNLMVVCGEGESFITHFVVSASVSEIYINFPDPWPKNRHAKHRLLKLSFIEEMARILCKAGRVTFVTDDLTYLTETQRLFARHPSFQMCEKMEDPVGYGNSYFDSLWREKGRTIYYVAYCTQ